MIAQETEAFEANRRYLTGLAYRMLGSMSEAQDIVQDAYLRWHGIDHGAIDEARAYLAKVVTRLCLDQLKSARVKRETYVGPWLPEPLIDAEALKVYPPDDLAEDLSVNFLLALERLSPLERAAFLLHDIFDMEFEAVAAILDKSEIACRQLASRARGHVRQSKPRFAVSPEHGAELAQAFLAAVSQGDLDALTRLLAEDAVLHSDGGGKVPAALRPIVGPDKIARFFLGIARKLGAYGGSALRRGRINGLPGYLIVSPDGLLQTISFETDAAKIQRIYIVRNPDKLGHIGEI
jgi:RNA polymerase sigma-70 factor, ECF subfamily